VLLFQLVLLALEMVVNYQSTLKVILQLVANQVGFRNAVVDAVVECLELVNLLNFLNDLARCELILILLGDVLCILDKETETLDLSDL